MVHFSVNFVEITISSSSGRLTNDEVQGPNWRLFGHFAKIGVNHLAVQPTIYTVGKYRESPAKKEGAVK